MAPRPLIYTPSGRAGEYTDGGDAANLYSGCPHGCKYCYAPRALHRDRQGYTEVKPAPEVLKRLEYDLFVRHKDKPLPVPLFLSFSCDPYCAEEAGYELTKTALIRLHEHQSNGRILTKNGVLALRDILDGTLQPGDEFGVSLTCRLLLDSLLWEPGASTPKDRIRALKDAHDRGITTWVSLEPPIYPDQTLELIKDTHLWVDIYKVGKMNHEGDIDPRWRKKLPTVDWSLFAQQAMELLTKYNKTFYIKEDLRAYLPKGFVDLLKDGWWRQ